MSSYTSHPLIAPALQTLPPPSLRAHQLPIHHPTSFTITTTFNPTRPTLANHLSLSPSSAEKLKKTELEIALEEHLRTNTSKFTNDSEVSAFYAGVDPASPVKHRGGKAVSGGKADDEKEKKAPRARRQTIKAQASADEEE